MEFPPGTTQRQVATNQFGNSNSIAYFLDKRLRILHKTVEYAVRRPVDKKYFSGDNVLAY
jgi:hypothetical protein